MANPTTDLTQRSPRSPRVRLGGFVVLPRVLDKCRALLAGKNGEYNFNCPMDQRFFEFVGVDAEKFKAQVAAGKADGEMLDWVTANSSSKPNADEIASWSANQEQRAPADPDSRDYFNGIHKQIAPHREDIATWFDLLDMDDYVSYGGKA
ncbi:MAG: DUF5069 domain-containing protein [Verrucomicrobia bacterium]|nr:DUF5069 domain-containing protein [Verrucomicrobiota bacterium]